MSRKGTGGGRRRPSGRSGRPPQRGGRGDRGQRGTTPRRPESSGPRGVGGDQVEGRQAVRELLLARRRRVREIVLAAGMDPADILDDIIDLADEAKVPIREVGRGKFEAVARSEGAQGVVALAAPLPELDLDELLAAQRSVPFLLAVDSVTDPGNLGAILRSAEAAGVTGVLLPRHRSARLTPTVTKAAAGAIEHLRFASVPGIAAAISRLKDDEVWTVGLDAAGSVSVHDLSVASDAVALVVGAEGTGLSRLVRDRCDVLARIPMQGTVASLNVSAAAAVALFEVARLRAVAG